jgi:CHASE2 domain-containing sensor protein
MSDVDIPLIEKGIKYLAIALVGVILSLLSSSSFDTTTIILIIFSISLFLASYFYSKKVIESHKRSEK